ncbi:hypothetical protein PoB_004643400 [Plakobranchus ocellatus]|uniref:Uncharacterized protein n=1 Tax=Plakobranchus ocellatus TaxID=259542 RepID=A0AAV4BLY9_9GAST|nr:hypothetical protein PoB_004643400 [Plakobranchus ocellatus]
MSFCLTFHSILDNNIRHVYSGTPLQLTYRHSSEYPNMDQLRQRKDNQQLKNAVLRTSEYRSEYRCLIPRAPAFRIMSRHEIEEVVARLTRPTIASQGVTGTSERMMVKDQASKHPKYLGLKQVSGEEINGIVSRVNKPTRMSLIRDRSGGNMMPEVAA